MRLRLAAQQLRRTLAHTIRMRTTHKPAMIQEELQQRQGVPTQVTTQEEITPQPTVEVLQQFPARAEQPQKVFFAEVVFVKA
jgi:hypothetical protein